jgi:hypothetical protein
VYDIVIARATTDSPEFFFMGGLGGLEKLFHGMLSSHTFDLKRKLSWLLHHLGVASLLLPKGRTAHSRFKMPFDLNETGICSVK